MRKIDDRVARHKFEGDAEEMKLISAYNGPKYNEIELRRRR